MSMQITTDSLHGNIKQMAQSGYDNKTISIKDLMVISQIDKAIRGDIKSFKFIQDMIGENPKEELREPKIYNIQAQCRDCGKIFSEVVDVKELI
ncbi:hypothetical protein AGMMS50233_10110 [Endomicrobiia bacterium]|nr:hypothetical protein AGMMS50233_10110 [Endomicrobiia bacterium]